MGASATFERIRIIGFEVQYDYGQRSAFLAGHITFVGVVTVKDVIIDDYGADSTLEFSSYSALDVPDLPCYSDATESL